MERTIMVALPLPGPALSPNRKAHWRKKGEAAKIQRLQTHWSVKSECDRACVSRPATGPIRVGVTFYTGPTLYPAFRPRDQDNALASIKSMYDGIVDAGLVPDDTPRWMKREMPEIVKDKKSRGRLEIRITYLED